MRFVTVFDRLCTAITSNCQCAVEPSRPGRSARRDSSCAIRGSVLLGAPGGETGDPPRPVSVGLLVSPRPVSPKGPENRRAVHNSQSRPARARDGGRGGPEPSVSPGSRPRRGTRGGRTPSLARLAPESGGTRGPRPARLARLAPEAGGKAGVHSRPSRPARSQKKKGQRADLRAQSRPARPLTVDAGPQTRPSRPARSRDRRGSGSQIRPSRPARSLDRGEAGVQTCPSRPARSQKKKRLRADLRAQSRPNRRWSRDARIYAHRLVLSSDSLAHGGGDAEGHGARLARLARLTSKKHHAEFGALSRPARSPDGEGGGPELPVSPGSRPRRGTRGGRTPSLARLAPKSGSDAQGQTTRIARIAPIFFSIANR